MLSTDPTRVGSPWSARQITTSLVVACAVALHALWLPAHLAFDAHEGDGHSHGPPAERAHAGHSHHAHAGHSHHAHAGHGHHAPGWTSGDEDPRLPGLLEGHDPHHPHHPLTDHQPPAATSHWAGVLAALAPSEAVAELPELQLVARLRARAPPQWGGDPPPASCRPRAPPSA